MHAYIRKNPNIRIDKHTVLAHFSRMLEVDPNLKRKGEVNYRLTADDLSELEHIYATRPQSKMEILEALANHLGDFVVPENLLFICQTENHFTAFYHFPHLAEVPYLPQPDLHNRVQDVICAYRKKLNAYRPISPKQQTAPKAAVSKAVENEQRYGIN